MNQDLSSEWGHHETPQIPKDDEFETLGKRWTLKMLWEWDGMRANQLAAKAGISTTTLYKMNRKDPTVSNLSIMAVCQVLKISRDMYLTLLKDE